MIALRNRDEDNLWTRAAEAHLDFGALEAVRQADLLVEAYRLRRADMLTAEGLRAGRLPGGCQP